VPADVPDDLAAAGGVADQGQVAQVEGVDQAGEVVGVGVHLVAAPGLAGAAVPAPVVRDGAVAVLGEEQGSGLPRVGVQRPAVAEQDGCAVGSPSGDQVPAWVTLSR
jgi:hypothetical protein